MREQLLSRNVKRFRGGLVFKAHRLLYHSTLGSRVIKEKKNVIKTCKSQGVRTVYSIYSIPHPNNRERLCFIGSMPDSCVVGMQALEGRARARGCVSSHLAEM